MPHSLQADLLVTERPGAAVIRAAFDQLSKDGATWCVVGQTDTLPDHSVSDIDIVLAPEDAARSTALVLSVCRRIGGRIVQCFRHETAAYYFVIALPSETEQFSYLMLDCCGDYIRGGCFLLGAREVLDGRRPALDEHGKDRGFFVASAATEFIYYLLKKIDKKSLSDDQALHLSHVFSEAPHRARHEISRFFSARSERQLVHAATSGDWAEVQQNLTGLQADLHGVLRWSRLTGWIKDTGRIASRIVRPTGLQIVILGPDGCGKSSVAEDLVPRLAPMFRRIRRFHLFPSVLRSDSHSAPVEEPHGMPPRSTPASIVKIGYWWTLYTVGWLTQLFPGKCRSTLLMFDRYYHDILVDPRRYRFDGPMWLARLIGGLIPGPDLWIVLDAPADVLQTRKQEVSFEESSRQRKAYERFARQCKNAVVIDASLPLDEVVSEALEAVVDYMAERTQERLNTRR